MNVENLFVSCPGLCGLLLLITAHIDLYLFGKGLITVKQAIAHEAIFFILGLVGVFIVFILSLKWLLSKNWKFLFLGVSSSVSFWMFLTIAGNNGAAILNAT